MIIQKAEDPSKLKKENIRVLTDSEVECLDQVRLLDLQTKLVQEFEDVTLRGGKSDRFSKENVQLKKLIPKLIE